MILVVGIEHSIRCSTRARVGRSTSRFSSPSWCTYLGLLVPDSHYLLVVRALRLLRVFRILKLAEFLREARQLQEAAPTGIVTVELAQPSRAPVSTQACPACGRDGHDADAAHCKFCGAAL